MDNKKFPVKTNQGALKVVRPAFSGVLIVIALLGVFLTSFDLLFIAVGVVGSLLFVAGNLVNKSLAISSDGVAGGDPLMTSLKQLQHQIAQTKYLSKVSDLGGRTHQQSLNLEEKWKFLNRLLQDKFVPDELTYSRYSNAVSEITHLILQNFKLLTQTLQSMETSISEEEFLKQKTMCQELLLMNENGLNQMSQLGNNLSLVNAGGSTDASMDEALSQLKQLADQAKKYSK